MIAPLIITWIIKGELVALEGERIGQKLIN
jgi:hypothetical protein